MDFHPLPPEILTYVAFSLLRQISIAKSGQLFEDLFVVCAVHSKGR